MNLLAFVDIHASLAFVKLILKKSKEADLLVCAGDLTNWGKDLSLLIKRLLDSEKKLIIIHGNHEIPSDFKNIKLKNLFYIHKKQITLNGFTFFGFGGGGFSLIDKEFEGEVKNIKYNKKLILVTHSPPYHTNLDKLPSGYAGNKSIRRFIEEKKPLLHICGHLHENEGKKDKINNTLIVNPGPKGILIKL